MRKGAKRTTFAVGMHPVAGLHTNIVCAGRVQVVTKSSQQTGGLLLMAECYGPTALDAGRLLCIAPHMRAALEAMFVAFQLDADTPAQQEAMARASAVLSLAPSIDSQIADTDIEADTQEVTA